MPIMGSLLRLLSSLLLLLLLFLCAQQQLVLSSISSCTRRLQWRRTNRCPAGSSSTVSVINEAQCLLMCTLRQPMCKAAHFNNSLCSMAVTLTGLSLWTTSEQCKSFMLAPELLQLAVFIDMRESLLNVLGSAQVASEAQEASRDFTGLTFAGKMTSLLRLSVTGGLSSLTDRNGESAVSFFMYVRREYKARTVYVKIGTDSADAINLFEENGQLTFTVSRAGRQFTYVSTSFMSTDADPRGFFLGVAASNITGAFAYLNNRSYSFSVDQRANSQVSDSLIRVGVSTSNDASCLNGTMVCFGIAPVKLSVDQFSRLSRMCL